MRFLHGFKKDKRGMVNKWALLWVAVLYLAGEAVGTLYFCLHSTPSQETQYLFDAIVAALFGGSFARVFSAHFLAYSIPAVVLLLCSFSTFGWAVEPFIILAKGVFFGCIASYLCLCNGWKGFLLYMALLWLPALVDLAVLLPLLYAGAAQALELQQVCTRKVLNIHAKRNCLNLFLCAVGADFVLCLGIGVACVLYF